MKNPEGYDNYTVNYPHQAAWLVYFNGLEVPVTTVTVEYGVNKIATCNVDMPPDPRLVRLGNEDRIELDVFYLDEFAYDSSQFCLMGEFDIVGWAYTNSASGRSLRFMALDTVQILQQLNMFYISAVDDIVNAYLPPQATKGDTFSVAMPMYPASLFLQGLMPYASSTGTTETNPEGIADNYFITSPYQFVRNVFSALLMDYDDTNADPTATANPQTQLPSASVSAPGRNFFARYILFRDLYRRFVGLPYIDKDMVNKEEGCFPILKACQSTEVMGAIQQQLGASVGPSGNVWDILQMVLNTMLMEITSIPAPPVAMAEVLTGVMVDLFSGKRTDSANKTMGVIASHVVKPQCYFGIPPACNVIFPSMVQSLSLEENYLPQPTRVYLGEQFLSNIITAKQNTSSAQIVESTLTTGYPPVVKARMAQYELAQYQNTKNFLIYPEEFFRGPVSRQLNAPPWLWLLDKFRNQLTTGESGTGGGTPSAGGKGVSGSKAKWGNSTKAMANSLKATVLSMYDKLSIPPQFVWARMYKESGLRVHATPNHVGAVGVMQCIPATQKDAGDLLKGMGLLKEPIDPADPVTSTMMGIAKIYKDCKALDIAPNELVNRDAFVFSPTKPISLGSVVVLAYVYGAGGARRLNEMAKTGGYNTLSKKVKGKKRKVIGHTETGNTMADAARVYPKGNKDTPGYELLVSNFVKAWDSAQSLLASTGATTPPPPVTDTTAPKTEVAGTPETTSNPVEQGQDDMSSLGVLFDRYAQYEYYRARYESRIGAAVLAFNPYIVPAFPAVMFDSKYSGISTYGYILNVVHQMSAAAGAPNMTTTVNSAFQRTIDEALANTRRGWDATIWSSGEVPKDTYPTEVIDEVAQIFQSYYYANSLYGKLLYLKKLDVPLPPEVEKGDPDEEWESEEDKEENAVSQDHSKEYYAALSRRDKLARVKGPSHAFNFRRIVNIVRLGTNGEVIEEDVPQWAYSDNMEIRPHDAYKELFRSYDAAMTYVARPACTLQQYIELRHGKSLEDAIKAGYVAGEDSSFYSRLTSGKNKTGAKFWSRIFMLRPGPGNPREEDLYDFANCGPADEDYPPRSGGWRIVKPSDELPQTRQDWDKILTDYRNMVRAEDSTGGAPRR